MKITHNKVGQNLNITDSGKSEKSEGTQKSKAGSNSTSAASIFNSSADQASRVNLSDKALEAKKIKELALAAPDVDQAKVERFRKLIDEGNYKVDAKAVADKMVDEEIDLLN